MSKRGERRIAENVYANRRTEGIRHLNTSSKSCTIRILRHA
jgi:hypothetical protein